MSPLFFPLKLPHQLTNYHILVHSAVRLPLEIRVIGSDGGIVESCEKRLQPLNPEPEQRKLSSSLQPIRFSKRFTSAFLGDRNRVTGTGMFRIT